MFGIWDLVTCSRSMSEDMLTASRIELITLVCERKGLGFRIQGLEFRVWGFRV